MLSFRSSNLLSLELLASFIKLAWRVDETFRGQSAKMSARSCSALFAVYYFKWDHLKDRANTSPAELRSYLNCSTIHRYPNP